MIMAKGICGTCGQGCHRTKHYGWQHDKPNKEADKEHFALTEANIDKVAMIRNKSKGGIETMKVRYERIYPPSHTDKQDPRCPECGDPMFYVGMRAELNKGDFIEHELYQCCTCRRLFQSKVIPQ